MMHQEMKEGVRQPNAEDIVRSFYDTYGWVKNGSESGEDALFRKFPEYYYRFYEKRTSQRTLACFAGLNGSLLIVGCGDMPENHVAIAKCFKDVNCMDISERALASAHEKMGSLAQYTHCSILNAPFPENTFDAVLCAHVLYHVDADEQGKAVREMIRVTRPGGRVIVIYSNPDSPFVLTFWKRVPLGRLARLRRGRRPDPSRAADDKPTLYFSAHPLGWWRQFDATCALRMVPWDIMGSSQARTFLRGKILPVLAYRAASWLERSAPGFAVKWWQYPIAVLEKKTPIEGNEIFSKHDDVGASVPSA